MVKIQLKQIMSCLKCDYEYIGDKSISIEGFCPINNLKKNSITWIKDIESFDIRSIDPRLKLLIVTNKNNNKGYLDDYNVIMCDEPKRVFFDILASLFPIDKYESGYVGKTSVVLTKNIGQECYIGEGCFINQKVLIGNNVQIHHNVSIEAPTIIGDNTIIWSGCRIGRDGFGYVKGDDGVYKKILHYGNVNIGSNVELASNVCIDRGVLDSTIIGNDVKIDSLTLVAHNARVGNKTLVGSGVVICGSCNIGEEVYIAPGAVIKNQLTIGKGAFIGMGAIVISDISPNISVFGNPARPFRRTYEI